MSAPATQLRPPTTADGTALWRLARSSGLDPNSAYYYLLFCRDFADTSVVAVHDSRIVGFVTGYLRPTEPDTLFVWQVAVDSTVRRQGVGLAMLAHLRDRLMPLGVRFVEASVTPSNHSSSRLFGSLATASQTAIAQEVLFGTEAFPQEVEHEPELVVRIGPFDEVSSLSVTGRSAS